MKRCFLLIAAATILTALLFILTQLNKPQVMYISDSESNALVVNTTFGERKIYYYSKETDSVESETQEIDFSLDVLMDSWIKASALSGKVTAHCLVQDIGAESGVLTQESSTIQYHTSGTLNATVDLSSTILQEVAPEQMQGVVESLKLTIASAFGAESLDDSDITFTILIDGKEI